MVQDADGSLLVLDTGAWFIHGCPISRVAKPEIRTRVFTKFWKHGTRGGSGLGMYIAHGLTTAQGGRIAIADAAGGGARIELLWPQFALDG